MHILFECAEETFTVPYIYGTNGWCVYVSTMFQWLLFFQWWHRKKNNKTNKKGTNIIFMSFASRMFRSKYENTKHEPSESLDDSCYITMAKFIHCFHLNQVEFVEAKKSPTPTIYSDTQYYAYCIDTEHNGNNFKWSTMDIKWYEWTFPHSSFIGTHIRTHNTRLQE